MVRIPARPSAARSLSLKICLAFLCAASLLGLAIQPAQAQVAKNSATINDYVNDVNGDGYVTWGLVQAPDGNFYSGSYQDTNILKIKSTGANTGSLSTLKGQLPAACGVNIVGNLILASDGNLYGVTSGGATNGYGAFFQYVIATETCTPLYVFNPSVDGSYPGTLQPGGGLTYGKDGNFYGTWSNGGLVPNQNGQVFQLTPAGKYNTIYNFCSTNTSGCPDGEHPVGFLIQATDGNWYGTTSNGGSGANQGVFFQLVPGTTFPWIENSLFNISCSQGCNQKGPIVEASDGYLYGAFDGGGANDGDGAIFQYDFQGDFIDFYDDSTQVEYPQSLFIGGDGLIYGTNIGFQCSCVGDIFSIAPGNASSWSQLGTFTASTLTNPQGPLLQGSDGNFYGGAQGGGGDTYGGAYQAVPATPIPAPVKVTLSSTTSAGSAVTVDWEVLNATSDTYRNCYLYEWDTANHVYSQGGGAFTGKATGTQSGSTLSGSASVTPSATGTYTFSVACAGTEIGISPVLTVTGISSFPTKTVLTASSNAVIYPGNDTLTATVTRSSGSGTPTGTVTVFCCGGDNLFTMSLNSKGIASQTVSSNGEPLGTYGLYGVYNGDADDTKSTSNTVNVSLKASTATTLSVSPTTITEPGTATITVTVTQTSDGKGTPGGTIDILADGSPVISNYTLSGGKATINASTKGFPTGTYQVTAKYNGTALLATSTSTPESVTLK
jgi:uncharacterized repeat protein (TIGR03803 family)